MLRILVPLVVLSTASALRSLIPQHRLSLPKASAASEAQIKFAVENKYDDTGPGAKKPEYAYNTYKTLDDALVAYLDDPDTKLPEQDRERAINKLLSTPLLQNSNNNWNIPKNRDKFAKPQFSSLNTEKENFIFPSKSFFQTHIKSNIKGIDGNSMKLGQYLGEKQLEAYKFQKVHTMKGSPLSLAHYSRDPDLKLAHDQFDPFPKYTFSYGVHDKQTGDSKQALESRDGGSVQGFYSFLDADGKTRTVHYTADDRQGFRATVQKTI